jgi:hypothetical protein
MTAPVLKELYNSPNGDRWMLSKDSTGTLVIIHHPNKSSGGRPSQVSVDAFLSQGRQGPEHHALVEALDSIGRESADNAHQELSAEAIAKLSCAVGQAVAQYWSRLPQQIQHELFEEAVKSQGESMRQQLAIYLHGHDERTAAVVQKQAMPK